MDKKKSAQAEVLVYLLYEGDEWLSSDSLVLMGIFTSKESFKANAEKLIRQRIKQHRRTASENGWEYGTDNEIVDDILLELTSRGSTTGWETNYTTQSATLDELGEI